MFPRSLSSKIASNPLYFYPAIHNSVPLIAHIQGWLKVSRFNRRYNKFRARQIQGVAG